MDLFILLAAIAFIVVFTLANIKLLYYYEHPDDKALNQAIVCKIMIIFGLLAAEILTMLLPIDVYNCRPGLSVNLWTSDDPQRPGGLDMKTAWVTMYAIIAFFLVIPLPFASYYYEADDDPRVTKSPPWKKALCYMVFTIGIFGIIIGVSFSLLNTASIPVQEISCGNWMSVTDTFPNYCTKAVPTTFKLNVSFWIYLVGIMSFFGWFLFVIFGGVGLTALPLDLILAFIDRPQACDLTTFLNKKKALGEKANKLKEIGDELRKKDLETRHKKGWGSGREKAKVAREFNKFRQAVFLLEREWAHMNVALKEKGENPVTAVGKLVCGICGLILSILWFIHILVYLVIRPQVDMGKLPGSRFLNDILAATDDTGIMILSLVIYMVFVVYLLSCVMKGCFKFGMRVFFLFPIHPMRPGETHLNTFLFNVGMILLSTTSVIQFSQDAFADYSRLTDADLIFSAQLKYLDFFTYFFKDRIFIYLLLAWSIITAIYLGIKPRDKIAFDLDFDKATESTQRKVQKEIEMHQRKAQADAVAEKRGLLRAKR
eukprot:GDKI01033357.1.p1 GENE.GDKI01033357.1~~GDKI01033357.1.p1  ORF type:complete len:543 (+),score=87.29 GDKI01033357.1:76-1704(+)